MAKFKQTEATQRAGSMRGPIALMLLFLVTSPFAFAQTVASDAKSKVVRQVPPVNPKAPTVSDVLEREMRVSEGLSDHYRSYRIGLLLRTRSPQSFQTNGVVPFLESLSLISSISDFERRCSQFEQQFSGESKALVLLTCGRLFLDSNELARAQRSLEKIPANSRHSVPGAVYLATLHLGRGDGERCTKILNSNLRRRIRNPTLRDLFHMTRGRCFLEISQFDSAVLEYQLINPSSSFYYDSLEETSWAQFRNRKLESSRTLLDVIITTYETGLGKNRAVSAAMYFRARYLQAYIELVENNVAKATGQFDALEQAISGYMKPQIENFLKARDFAKRIVTENSNWIDLKAIPQEIQDFLSAVGDWTDPATRKKMERAIELQLSLSKEKRRFQGEKEFEPYLQTVLALEAGQSKDLETLMVSAARAAAKAIRVLKIKSDLGRIEIKWVERTQGVRSIDELLETYRREVAEVEDHLNL